MNTKEAIKIAGEFKNTIFINTQHMVQAVEVLISIAEAVEKAGGELPEKKLYISQDDEITEEDFCRGLCNGFNECLSIAREALAKKNLEIAERKRLVDANKTIKP